MHHDRDARAASRPDGIDEAEWALRLELAACYRLFDHLGWTEAIFNHITVRVPQPVGATPHYLINPFGLHYSEVTASNLIKIDVDGKAIVPTEYSVNAAGFVIHSAIHAVRDDAHCIMHVHTTAGCAVACKESGLRADNFYSAMLFGEVAYHDYMGVTTDLQEQPYLVEVAGQPQPHDPAQPWVAGDRRGHPRRLPPALDAAARLRSPAGERCRPRAQPADLR